MGLGLGLGLVRVRVRVRVERRSSTVQLRVEHDDGAPPRLGDHVDALAAHLAPGAHAVDHAAHLARVRVRARARVRVRVRVRVWDRVRVRVWVRVRVRARIS